MPLNLDAIKEQVTRNRTVAGSTRTLLERLFAEFESHKNDPAAIQALVDEFRADIDAEIAALVANTPAESEPTEPTEPTEPSEPTDPNARNRR